MAAQIRFQDGNVAAEFPEGGSLLNGKRSLVVRFHLKQGNSRQFRFQIRPMRSPHAGNVRNQRLRQNLISFRRPDGKNAACIFGFVAGKFGQSFCRRQADGNRNVQFIPHRLPDHLCRFDVILPVKQLSSGQVKISFVHRTDFDVRRKRFELSHDFCRNAAVKIVIGTDIQNLRQAFLGHKIRFAHLQPQRFGFSRPRNDAAVVVGKNRHRPPVKPRIESPLRRNEKTVAVCKGNIVFHHSLGICASRIVSKSCFIVILVLPNLFVNKNVLIMFCLLKKECDVNIRPIMFCF